MSEFQHEIAGALFLQARNLPDAERASYLDEACGDDVELRAEVLSLLESDGDLASADSLHLGGQASESALPDQIGPYKIREQIGEGGFGVVYVADQKKPVRRRVALKVIKLGMDTKQVIARFEAERQALAMMEHPNIARALDVGATETGRPFFVMELVRGIPITEHCDQAKLETRSRLELFIKVCHATQHAHQKGIIHRDIKPNNILVTMHDGVPVPKVIDFGIAKATNAELTEKTLYTENRQMIGTPAYMSPEQAEMSGLDIDTRSDIYSLGVLLYELLTGTTPFTNRELREVGFGEIQRIIREREPRKPSTRLNELPSSASLEMDPDRSRHGTSVEDITRVRRTDLHALRKQLRGDLDWIVMKALEKERTRRYDTAISLAMDVRRHLDDEPVEASPPGARYRLRKFARRHRRGVIASGLIAASLLIGIVGTGIGFARASRAREAAAANAEQAEQVTAFLEKMISLGDPHEAKRPNLTMRDALDQASATIAIGLNEHPGVEARIRRAIGRAYFHLGALDRAETHVRESLAIREKLFGGEHTDVAQSLQSLAWVFCNRGDYKEAEKHCRRALTMLRRIHGEEHELVAVALQFLGDLRRHQLDYEVAESLLQDASKILRNVVDEEHPAVTQNMQFLTRLYRDQGRLEEAEKQLVQRLAILKSSLAANDPATLRAMRSLVNFYHEEGVSHQPAEELLTQALELHKRVLGEDHVDTIGLMDCLSALYEGAGRLDEAATLFAQALQVRTHVRGEKHIDTLWNMDRLAGQYQRLGRPDEAVALLAQGLEIRKIVLGEHHVDTLRAMRSLGRFYHEEAVTHQAAEELLTQTLELHKRVLGEEHIDTIGAMDRLAALYERSGRLEDAAALFARALQIRTQMQGEKHTDTLWNMDRLAGQYQGLGRLDEAIALFAQALEIRKRVLGEHHAHTLRNMQVLEGLYRQQGRTGETEAMHNAMLEASGSEAER